MIRFRRTSLALVVIAVAGCSSGASAGPTFVPTGFTTILSPTLPLATPSPTMPMATPSPTPSPTNQPTFVLLYEFTFGGKAGGHGGPPLLDLPASIIVDYTVSGSCEFTIHVSFGVPDVGLDAAKLRVEARGPTISGTWPVTLKPGPYYVVGSEANGCPFRLSVRAA